MESEKQEVARRLRPVCLDMPEAEFAQLVNRIVTITFKYVNQRSEAMFRRPGRSDPVEPAKG